MKKNNNLPKQHDQHDKPYEALADQAEGERTAQLQLKSDAPPAKRKMSVIPPNLA